MITDEDVKKIEKSLTSGLLRAFEAVFATKEDLRKQSEQIDEKLVAFRSDILSHVDANMKEILAVRDEQSAHTYSHMRQDEKHAEHERRIRRLEKNTVSLNFNLSFKTVKIHCSPGDGGAKQKPE